MADSPRAWLSGNIDIQPPDSVLCAQFEKLFIKLEFSTAKRRLPVAKNDERNTEDPTHTDSTDLMLLDPFQILIDSHQLEEFEAVVQYQSQQLSKSIAECFESLRSKFSPPDQMLFDIIPPLAAASPTMPPPPCHDNGHEGVEDSVQEVFPLVEVPTARGGSDLDMRESHFQESEMLLAAYSPVQETLLVESESHEEDMRLSQPISDIPSQISQSLTCSTVSTISQLMPESSIRNNTRGDLDLSILSQVSKISPLVKQGLHILIGGYGRCAHQETKDIQSRRPHPETSLSKIAPSIFSPGFREVPFSFSSILSNSNKKQSMSHNAKFLPIISRAMSITLPRNVQSSMLRSNLLKLAQSDKSAIPNINDESLERGSVQRLAAVVQTRLWAMMQKWVYDTSAARKLAWGGIAEEGVLKIDGIEEGRHGGLCYPTSSKIECSTTVGLEVGIDKTGEEDRDDFEDLLAAEGTEEDLLAYFDESEIERLEIEHETDEMLLGAGWDYGGKEIDDGMLLLLGSSSEVDSMLL